MTLLLLCSALCTVAGGALGAAWRRAETRRACLDARHWQDVAVMRQQWANAYEKLYRLASRQASERLQGLLSDTIPDHELPMSCPLGSRPSESVRREGPTVARTLDQLMEER